MKTRASENEQLDDLSLAGEPLHRALLSIAWVNKYFGNNRAIISSVSDILQPDIKSVTIVDLGCGGGDTVLRLAQHLQKINIPFSITGIDGNKNTLQYAKEKCVGFTEIEFIHADILQEGFRIPSCDILISSHFIYHFSNDGLVRFIEQSQPLVNLGIIFSELERRTVSMRLFKLFSFLLPMSDLARQDGLLAIKRSLTRKEWNSIVAETNIQTAKIARVPLFRLLVCLYPN